MIGGLYFVVMTFMHSGSDCGFKFMNLRLIWDKNYFQLLHNNKINGESLNKLDYISQ